jgi:predicted peroxiredoxin
MEPILAPGWTSADAQEQDEESAPRGPTPERRSTGWARCSLIDHQARRKRMSDGTRDLVVMITRGTDHELSSIGFTIANGGLTAGLRVSIFLTSAGVDLVRKRASDTTQVNPLEPLSQLINDFLRRGGNLWACTPCVKARGYSDNDLIEGVVITGASKVHELIKVGAATLSF